MPRNFYESEPHQIKTVRRVSLLADYLPGANRNNSTGREVVINPASVAKDRHVAQVGIKRTHAIGLVPVERGRVCSSADVEDIAQHFDHRAIGFGAHRCRARIVIHAGHFAEEFARTKLGDRMS